MDFSIFFYCIIYVITHFPKMYVLIYIIGYALSFNERDFSLACSYLKLYEYNSASFRNTVCYVLRRDCQNGVQRICELIMTSLNHCH